MIFEGQAVLLDGDLQLIQEPVHRLVAGIDPLLVDALLAAVGAVDHGVIQPLSGIELHAVHLVHFVVEGAHRGAAPGGGSSLFQSDHVQTLLCAGQGGRHARRPLAADQHVDVHGLCNVAVRNGIGHKGDLALAGCRDALQVFLTGGEAVYHFLGRGGLGGLLGGDPHGLADAVGGGLLDGVGGEGGPGDGIDLGALGVQQGLLEIGGRVAGQVDGLVGGVHRDLCDGSLGEGHGDGHFRHAGRLGGVGAGRVNGCARRRGSGRRTGAFTGADGAGGDTAHGRSRCDFQKAFAGNFFHLAIVLSVSLSGGSHCVFAAKGVY